MRLNAHKQRIVNSIARRRNFTSIIAVMLITFMVAGKAWSLTIAFVDPPGGHPPPPPTGHPVKPWTGPERTVLGEALSEWDAAIDMFEHHGGAWTLRWEDDDLFKNWGLPNCNFANLGAVTGTVAEFQRCRIPGADFPTNEIFFDVRRPWFVDPSPAFDGDDHGEVPAGQFDLLTVAKHELGHALGILGHLPDGTDAVMENPISPRERHRITPRDLAFVRQQGGDLAMWVVPEPSTWILLTSGLGGLAWFARNLRFKKPEKP